MVEIAPWGCGCLFDTCQLLIWKVEDLPSSDIFHANNVGGDRPKGGLLKEGEVFRDELIDPLNLLQRSQLPKVGS